MLQIGVTSIAAQARDAREAVRGRLGRAGLDPDHVRSVEAVAHELLAAVFESGVTDPVILTVEPLPLVTQISVKASSPVQVRDEPLGLRERILDELSLEHGQRPSPDGTVELWATVERPPVS